MTKDEMKRLVDILDLWIENCESFYNGFKNDFIKRPDAVNELIVRCDKVHFMNEFLEECRFISTDKYLEIADRYEKVLDGLNEVLHSHGGCEQMTDEEMAEDYLRATVCGEHCANLCEEPCIKAERTKKHYLAGLKAGEEKAKKEIEEELLKCYQGYPEKEE